MNRIKCFLRIGWRKLAVTFMPGAGTTVTWRCPCGDAWVEDSHGLRRLP